MKKLISVCLALMLVLACIPLQASAEEGTPTFAVGTAEALRLNMADAKKTLSETIEAVFALTSV